MRSLFVSVLFQILFTVPVVFADAQNHGHHHEQGAHVHGHVNMNMALENDQLYIELRSPAVNIVGFEHQPQTQAQKETVSDAIRVLRKAGQHFSFPESAQCVLVSAEIKSELVPDEHKHDHEIVSHKSHAAKHSDFDLSYAFDCKRPGELDYIDVLISEAFPGIEHILVQYLMPSGQGAAELEPGSLRIKF